MESKFTFLNTFNQVLGCIQKKSFGTGRTAYLQGQMISVTDKHTHTHIHTHIKKLTDRVKKRPGQITETGQ